MNRTVRRLPVSRLQIDRTLRRIPMHRRINWSAVYDIAVLVALGVFVGVLIGGAL